MNWRYYVDDALHKIGVANFPPGSWFCNYYERWVTR